jgi:hypothetical protein
MRFTPNACFSDRKRRIRRQLKTTGRADIASCDEAAGFCPANDFLKAISRQML